MENPEYLQHFFHHVLESSSVFKAFLFQRSPNYFQTHMQKKAVEFVEKSRLIKITDQVVRHHLAAMIGACLYTTIVLII